MDINSGVEAKVQGHALYTMWARMEWVSLNARKRRYVLATNGNEQVWFEYPSAMEGFTHCLGNDVIKKGASVQATNLRTYW